MMVKSEKLQLFWCCANSYFCFSGSTQFFLYWIEPLKIKVTAPRFSFLSCWFVIGNRFQVSSVKQGNNWVKMSGTAVRNVHFQYAWTFLAISGSQPLSKAEWKHGWCGVHLVWRRGAGDTWSSKGGTASLTSFHKGKEVMGLTWGKTKC